MGARRPRPLYMLAVAVAVGSLFAADAHAQSADNGTVSGSVRAPSAGDQEAIPVVNQGFVPRIKNPIIPTTAYDPLEWVIVVLEPKSSLSPEQSAPPKAASEYTLVGESFATPIFPLTVGGAMEIKNAGRNAHRLTAPTMPELLSSDPINPGGQRSVSLETPETPVDLRGVEAHHVRGRIVAFSSRWHSLVNGRGEFTIEDVPPGRWSVRLWYRDGWLKVSAQTIEVTAKRTTNVKLVLPNSLDVEAAGGGK